MQETFEQLRRQQFIACMDERGKAIEALCAAAKRLRLHETSERVACEHLGNEMRTRGICDYWYPAGEAVGSKQFGCIVAFDTERSPNRTAFDNGRSLQSSDTNLWEGLGYFYASPQAVAPGGLVVWGDIGCTVYTGEDEGVRSALRLAWARNEAVLDELAALPSPTTFDLFELNRSESAKHGLVNVAWSQSTHGFNIGHSFPISISRSVDQGLASKMARQREYVDGATRRELSSGLWTYEARDTIPGYRYGAVQFHEIVTVSDGSLRRLPSYLPLFEEVGMNWILDG